MRRSDWLQRMWEALRAAEGRPFELGSHDCVHLVAATLDAMTGSDWVGQLKEVYRAEGGALRVMCRPERLAALVSERLGPALPVALARRGDVVAITQESGPAIGVCVGHLIAVAGDGVCYLPLARARCAWRVE